jgi:hypothetical protein
VTKEKWELAYLFSTLFLFYLLPCLLLFILYGKVVIVIKNRNEKMKQGGLMSDAALKKPVLSAAKLRKAHTCKLTSKEVEELNLKKKKFTSRPNQETIEMASTILPAKIRLSNTNASDRVYKTKNMNPKPVITLLIIMMLLILICLLPYRVFSLWAVLASKKQLLNLGLVKFYNLITLCRVTFYINSALNPIFYHIISTKFQASFKKFFKFSHKETNSASRIFTTSTSQTNHRAPNRFLSLRLNN